MGLVQLLIFGLVLFHFYLVPQNEEITSILRFAHFRRRRTGIDTVDVATSAIFLVLLICTEELSRNGLVLISAIVPNTFPAIDKDTSEQQHS